MVYPNGYTYGLRAGSIPERVYKCDAGLTLYPNGYISVSCMKNDLSIFLKKKRKLLNMTQRDLAERAGVGLRFIRDAEQGKRSLDMDKINQVLSLFGHEMGPVPKERNRDDE